MRVGWQIWWWEDEVLLICLHFFVFITSVKYGAESYGGIVLEV